MTTLPRSGAPLVASGEDEPVLDRIFPAAARGPRRIRHTGPDRFPALSEDAVGVGVTAKLGRCHLLPVPVSVPVNFGHHCRATRIDAQETPAQWHDRRSRGYRYKFEPYYGVVTDNWSGARMHAQQ